MSAKATIRNAKTKRQVRESIKSLNSAISKGNSDTIREAYNRAISEIDKAIKKHVMHKNKGARKKSQLANQIKLANINLKPKTKKAVAKKTVVKTTKKTTAKNTPSKKPAAKKSAQSTK